MSNYRLLPLYCTIKNFYLCHMMRQQDIHICFGPTANSLLIQSNEFDPATNRIICMEDHLCDGPLCDINTETKTGEREEWISSVSRDNEYSEVVTNYVKKDLDRIQTLIAEADSIHRIFLWTGFDASEIVSTARLLYHLSKLKKEVFIADFPHIPITARSGEIIYPDILAVTNTSDIKEIFRHFKRVDNDSLTRWVHLWEKILSEDGLLWVLEKDGDISAHDETYFDSYLTVNCTDQFQSAAWVIGHTLIDIDFGVGDMFLNWRLKQLSRTGKIAFRGELKEIRDYQVKRINRD